MSIFHLSSTSVDFSHIFLIFIYMCLFFLLRIWRKVEDFMPPDSWILDHVAPKSKDLAPHKYVTIITRENYNDPPILHPHSSCPGYSTWLHLPSFFSFPEPGSFYLFYCIWAALCSMWDLFPDEGLNPRPLHWKHRVSTTGPPGSSWNPGLEKGYTSHLTIRSVSLSWNSLPTVFPNTWLCEKFIHQIPFEIGVCCTLLLLFKSSGP